MNSIQRYVINSLFAQKQITADLIAKALDTFSNKAAIDAFLTVLVTGEIDPKERKIVITGEVQAKLQILKVIKDVFCLDLKYAKDIVDEYSRKDNLTFPLQLVYKGKVEDLNIEQLKNTFSSAGYTFDII